MKKPFARNQPKKAERVSQTKTKSKGFATRTAQEKRKILHSSAGRFNKDFGAAIKQLANE